jgi:cellulose synthase/poly-beta-1,6-N-acetylglucosamine synthase-like glycosyltransferase
MSSTVRQAEWQLIGFTLLIAAILAPLVLVTGYFAVEVFSGLRPLPADGAMSAPPRTSVLVPAHDEEAVIGRTVGHLRREAPEGFGTLVIADNCTDRTAIVAKASGAGVLVRNEPDLRGKGYALAAAREFLRRDPPEVVIVHDADCCMDGRSLAAVAGAAVRLGRPCQSVNLLAPDLAASPLVQISSFAFLIKNLVRQRGLQRLAGRAHLTGTGMALPWSVFERANLGGGDIVEDLAMGLEFSEAATRPILIEGATIWSPAASQSGTLTQRRRWEGGYLATAIRTAPRQIGRSIAKGDWNGIAAGLNLAVPPLALLVLLNVAGFGAALLAAFAGASAWPLFVQLAVGLVALLALVLAWVREGRRFASVSSLLRLPLYLLWKLPVYVGFARRGAPREWLRSGR